MLVLLGIGFLAGVITAISPCVLPVLPIVLAGGATGGRRRPYAIIAGLVVSFAVFTLFASWILSRLGLPGDLLRNVAIAMLFVLAATLIVPRIGVLVERPFQFLTHRRGGDLGGGLLLGVSLGLVFVPCAGPVLTVVTVVSASQRFGARSILLTLAYALGTAVPMLLIALGGQRIATRMQSLRRNAGRTRAALGAVMALTALLIVFNVDRHFTTALPGYTNALQKAVESNSTAKKALAKLTGAGQGAARAAGYNALEDFGPAPEFRGNFHWLNTPGERPLTLAGLRGKVVLVDFWTYSCINCLRTLPHLEAWDRAYRKDGLVIVGVHTPEFAFEHVLGNVRKATHDLGVRYPVALDNGYATWNAYSNQYWPAEYLIDRRGHVRHAHFGEGEYDRTEALIRELLAEPGMKLPPASRIADATPADLITPESYLGYARLDRYAGSQLHLDREAAYAFPLALPQNELAYAGLWRVEPERILAGPGARLQLRFQARKVHLVLGGRGTVQVLVDGRPVKTVGVAFNQLYTLAEYPRLTGGLLELRFSPGVEAYAFTFS